MVNPDHISVVDLHKVVSDRFDEVQYRTDSVKNLIHGQRVEEWGA